MQTLQYDVTTRIDVPVTAVELEHGVSANVSFLLLAPGIVPLFEEHEARLERGLGLETWLGMETQERALVIAARRIRHALANLQADAELKAAKRKGKTGKR